MPMSNLEKIYDAGFFSKWGSENPAYIASARVICKVLHQKFQPTRIVDIGCGSAAYAHFFKNLSVKVVCIDGVLPPERYAYEKNIKIRDLTQPFANLWGRFDLSLCLDVGEHIPEASSEIFLDNITQFSDRLVLSCAPPGQGGHHHVNEQPKRYWIEKLKRHGFAYNRKTTGQLCETFKRIRTAYMWMWEHVSIYERSF